MTQTPELRRAAVIHPQFLNETGLAKLADLGIFRGLITALSDEDAEELVVKNIFFNPIWSPASRSSLIKQISVPAEIITIDINAMLEMTKEEGVAVILHEIGHAINPAVKKMEGEFTADKYAVDRGYGAYIISSLEKNVIRYPEYYDNESTKLRIAQVKSQEPVKPAAAS